MRPNFEYSLRKDPDYEVKDLFLRAKKRKEDMMKYRLIAQLLDGKIIDVTKSTQLYEALNKEKMEFEQILKLHPEEVKEQIEYVKQRKLEQNGKWYNPDSKAKWGEKGVIPPCCYYARPPAYWKDKSLANNFLNTFSVFKIAEGKL
jgi:acetoin utilization deacetylase AcuC-like enzyme